MHTASIKMHAFAKGAITKPIRTSRPAVAIVTGGAGMLIADGQQLVLEAGSCILLPPLVRIQVAAAEERELRLQWLQLHAQHGSSLPLFEQLSSSVMNYAALGRIDQLLEQLTRSMAAATSSARLKEQALLCDIVASILEQQELAVPPSTPQDGIEAARSYIEAHYTDKIYTAQLAALAGMTPSSFCRSFKRTVGMTPGQYVTHWRLSKAKQYMEHGSYPMKTIAHQVGFEDELYFSRVFKKSEGVSPSAYLRSENERVAVVSSLFLQDHMLALGTAPVAAPSIPSYYATPSGFPSYLHHRLAGTMPLNAERDISWHEVLRAKPTLIVTNEDNLGSPSSEQREQPVATITLGWKPDWLDYQYAIASCLRKETAAERIVKTMSQLESDARDELRVASRRGRWAIVRVVGGECRIYGRHGHALSKLFHEGLGFEPDEHLSHELYITGGLEQLAAWNPEHILFMWSEPEQIRQLRKHPLWRELRAVREGKLYHPNNKEWDPWGPFGRQHMIRELLRYFGSSRRFV